MSDIFVSGSAPTTQQNKKEVINNDDNEVAVDKKGKSKAGK